jgi:hypothetical protein
MLFVALAVSAFFAFCVCQGVRTGARKEYGVSCAIAGVGVIAGWMCMQSPFFMLNALLVAIATFLCSAVAAGVRTFRISVIAATFLAYLTVSVVFVLPELREASKRKDEHPLESMADRLAYEKGSRQREPITGPALERLLLLERQIGDPESRRVAELREIHQSYVIRFANSDGFGVVRLLGKNANSAFGTVGSSIAATMGVGGSWSSESVPQERSIKLPLDYEEPNLIPKYRDSSEEDPASKIPGKGAFLTMHQAGLVDFINTEGFGYVEDRRHVAGFRPHGFRLLPSLERSENSELWELRRLDLISLLTHEEPVAYVSEDLPQMKQLRAAPVRSLDEIEKKMLRAVQGGEDLQMAWAGDRIRMVGSIRAARQCVKCHDVNRGELLGAFSYKFQRR